MKRLKQKEKEEKAKKFKKAKKTHFHQSASFVDGKDEDEKVKESQKKDATRKQMSDDNDVKCPVYCNDDPYEKWVCCDICDTWYHTGCPDECSQLKDMDWFCHR